MLEALVLQRSELFGLLSDSSRAFALLSRQVIRSWTHVWRKRASLSLLIFLDLLTFLDLLVSFSSSITQRVIDRLHTSVTEDRDVVGLLIDDWFWESESEVVPNVSHLRL